MTKTCSQCGAVLPSGARVCLFCDSSFSLDFLGIDEPSRASAQPHPTIVQEAAWRGELAQRLNAYHARRRKPLANHGQARLSFDEFLDNSNAGTSIATKEPAASPGDDFSFSIAIGRPSKELMGEESPMEIDVSLRPGGEEQPQARAAQEETKAQPEFFPVASIDDRRLAAIIDLFCLLFAYGGFLGLFGSLGGHFAFSKLSVAVCATTFAAVYLQYFALFTIFGGTTPGMMLRGLQVVSFSGEQPTPKQMLLRAAGYLLSAGTLFLGFLWAMWDDDELTWHDRLSRTYLSAEQTLPDVEAPGAAHSS